MKTCADIQPVLAAYLDGELDPIHSLEVEQHLARNAPRAPKTIKCNSRW